MTRHVYRRPADYVSRNNIAAVLLSSVPLPVVHFCAVAMEVFKGGAANTEVFTGGAVAREVFIGGAVASQTDCD